LILETLKELSAKKTVIIPAYICPLVPLAIKRAGLNIEVCDINYEDFNFNYAELESLCRNNTDILAVIPTHLAGIPVEIDKVLNIAKERSIFVIEDCAQSLGAEYSGKKVGTFADFAFFSLARGKGLTIYEGGAATTNNDEYAKVLNAKAKLLAKGDIFSETLKLLELAGYWLFYNPFLFWFVFRLPQVFWKMQGRSFKAAAEEYSTSFGIHRVSKLRKFIGHLSFYRLEDEISAQREKAAYYINNLKEGKGIRIIQEKINSRSTYPFLVLLFDDLNKRERILRDLENAGLGASIVYASPVSGYPYLKNDVPQKNIPAALSLNQRQITLSTNSFLKSKDLSLIVETIKR
jgi:dTDP-4-amino-4,6-dideoxygalactose transaminase